MCAGTEALTEAREQRKGEPPILSSPRMARNAVEGRSLDAFRLRNLRRRGVEGSMAEQAEELPEWSGRGTSDASRLRNLRRRGVEGSMAEQVEEPPEWPGRGTSGAARLRNLRQGSVEGSAAERRIRASDQLKP